MKAINTKPTKLLQRQRIALRKSIRKWQKIVNGTGVDNGTDNCALCAEFHAENCTGCPIKEITHEQCCNGTPYELWENEYLNANGKGGYSFACVPEQRIAATAMLNFLKAVAKAKGDA